MRRFFCSRPWCFRPRLNRAVSAPSVGWHLCSRHRDEWLIAKFGGA